MPSALPVLLDVTPMGASHFFGWDLIRLANLQRGPVVRPYATASESSIARHLPDVLAVLGTVLIAAAVLLFEGTDPFPGWRALLPTAGAACLIQAGPGAKVNKLILSHPAAVCVGLISYPLYLWHWPVLIIAASDELATRLAAEHSAAHFIVPKMFDAHDEAAVEALVALILADLYARPSDAIVVGLCHPGDRDDFEANVLDESGSEDLGALLRACDFVLAVTSANLSAASPAKEPDDVRRVIDAAKAIAIPMDREVIHILPQEFIIHDQDGIREPLGMSWVRLEARVHIVTGAVASAQTIIKSCNRAGLDVADIVLEQLGNMVGAARIDAEAVRQRGEFLGLGHGGNAERKNISKKWL